MPDRRPHRGRARRGALIAWSAVLGLLVACIEPAPGPSDDGSGEPVAVGLIDTEGDRATPRPSSPFGPKPRRAVAGRCDEGPVAERIVELGEAFAPDGRVQGELGPCDVPLVRGVASRAMRLEARLILSDRGARARLLRLDAHSVNGGYTPTTDESETFAGETNLLWSAERTGEYGLAVVFDDADPEDGDGRLTYRLDVVCLEGCDAGMTRFPIVLLHGMGGTDSFLGLFDYFLGVVDAMTGAGFDVHVTIVDPVASSDVRAAQLVPQLEEILAETGARRLNLIGHSQGGVDGRALIVQQGFGDRVASLTTLATPHRGVLLADILSGVVDGTDLGRDLADEVADLYGGLLGRDGDQSLSTSLRELTVSFMTEQFNPRHPDDPRVAYYSWAGRTCALFEVDCRRRMHGELVNPLLAAPYRAMQTVGVQQSDGLVGVESAQWGEFLGLLPADHLAEVGLRVDSIFEEWDHLDFFIAEGDRLFAAGY